MRAFLHSHSREGPSCQSGCPYAQTINMVCATTQLKLSARSVARQDLIDTSFSRCCRGAVWEDRQIRDTADLLLILRTFRGGRDRDRTCDPYHVKVVLFR